MADTLYAALGASLTTSDLYTVDPATGAMTSVGPIGFAITGLAQDPTDGTLYAVTSNNSAAHPRSLISIDLVTGAGTFIGALTPDDPAPDLCVDSDGTAYALAQGSGAALVTIDLATGVDTEVGDTGLGVIAGGGISIDPLDGQMYLWNFDQGSNKYSFLAVDKATAAVTVIFAGTPSGPNINALAFDSSGVLWGVQQLSTTARNLVTVDLATGTLTTVGAMTNRTDALAWVSPVTLGCSLALDSATLSVVQGSSGTDGVTSTLTGGPDSNVTLSSSGEPAGVTVAFGTNPIDENGGASTITVTVGLAVAVGSYPIAIHGLDGNGHACATTLTLTVTAFRASNGLQIRERVPFN